MLDLLFNVFVAPLVLLMELCFRILMEIFEHRGLSIIGLSFVLNLITLPMYHIAEKFQQAERDIQEKIKPRIKQFKSVFSGSKLHMIIRTYYRQIGYHPLYALRSLSGLIIQVPFFIAAYHFLSNLHILNHARLLFIRNLAAPDQLLQIGTTQINLLPVIMTLINFLSIFIYAKDHGIRARLKLYIPAVLFLVLLYNSPSGLVLYWTCNNLISLVKNIIYKKKNPLSLFKKIIKYAGVFAFLAVNGMLTVNGVTTAAKLIPLVEDAKVVHDGEHKIFLNTKNNRIVLIKEKNTKYNIYDTFFVVHYYKDKNGKPQSKYSTFLYRTKNIRVRLPENYFYRKWRILSYDLDKNIDYTHIIFGQRNRLKNIWKQKISFETKGQQSGTTKILGAVVSRFITIALLFNGFVLLIWMSRKTWRKTSDKLSFLRRVVNQEAGLLKLTVSAGFLIAVLAGFLSPALLINTSVEQFIQNFGGATNPAEYVLETFLIALSLFVLLPFALFMLFKNRPKTLPCSLYASFALLSLLNFILFSVDYGDLSLAFIFDKAVSHSGLLIFTNIALTLGILTMVLYIRHRSRKQHLTHFFTVSALSVFIIGVIMTIDISHSAAPFLHGNRTAALSKKSNITPEITLSPHQRNVVILVLDRSIGGLVPSIMSSFPAVKSNFSGFCWYPNTVSFHDHTLLGMPPIYGGYNYVPKRINERKNTPLKQKHNEALLVLPRIFLKKKYNVQIFDPPYANYNWTPDLSIYNGYNLKRTNMRYTYHKMWLKEISASERYTSQDQIQSTKFLKFGIFRVMPVFLRTALYDNGAWLDVDSNRYKVNFNRIKKQASAILRLLSDYAVLDFLPELSQTGGKSGAFVMLCNNTVHEANLLPYPADFPGLNTDQILHMQSTSPYSDPFTVNHYTVQALSFARLGEWFNWMKKHKVYDNTKIILVSDHGVWLQNPMLRKHGIKEPWFSGFHPTLMIKDFDSKKPFFIQTNFMTTADVAHIAVSHLKDAINPYTGKQLLQPDKSKGVDIYTASWKIKDHPKNVFKTVQHWRVKDSIFNRKNWTRIK